MAKDLIKPTVITSVSQVPQKRVIPRLAYQMQESGNGGYYLYRIVLDQENKMVSRDKISDPDGWDQIILLLEAELSKQFQ